jgi:hypothetical protein
VKFGYHSQLFLHSGYFCLSLGFMENITTGHWIFAGVFMLFFIAYLIWSYRKDLKLHRTYYGGAFYVLIGIVLVLFVFYVFKRLL